MFDATSTHAFSSLSDDIALISDILKYRRAPGTKSFRQFATAMIEPVFGKPDASGNYILTVGTKAPHTAFVAHSDTVETQSGRVVFTVDTKTGIIGLSPKDKDSRCLGADDGAGIFLLLEMIRNQVPGLYLICAKEEVGCVGARDLAARSSVIFKGITAAIEFDRHDLNGNEVITHMCVGQTAGNLWSETLADALGMGFKPSDDGLITDTAEFVGLVANCTNITVGYRGHHTRRETLDLFALRALRDRLVALDWDALSAFAVPFVPTRRVSYPMFSNNWGKKNAALHDVYDDWCYPYGSRKDQHDPLDDLEDQIAENPRAVAELLFDMGYDSADISDYIYGKRFVN
jgi:hypothetical protein